MDSGYINRFLKAWVVGLPIAIAAALLVGPIARKFVDKITKQKDLLMEIIIFSFIAILVVYYLFGPTSKSEEKTFKSKDNWRGGF